MSSIVALIISIIGCLIMGNSSSIMTETINIAFFITLLGLGVTIYSLAKKDYKKLCIILSFIANAISFIIFALLKG